MTQPIIIIGSGLAGYHLAKALRQLDSKTPLVILTASNGEFYSKPLLSTAFQHQKTPDNLPFDNADVMSKQLNATIHTHTQVTGIDPKKNQVITNNQPPMAYKKLVMACGSKAIQWPTTTKQLTDSVPLSVNNLEDYRLFRQHIEGKKRIVIIGAGLVGCEFANDLAQAGFQVDIVANSLWPLDRLLPQALGQVFQQRLADAGVNWHMNQTVQSITAQHDQQSHINHYQIISSPSALNSLSQNNLPQTANSSQITQLTADGILSAIGIQPNIALAQSADIAVNQGIIVDRYLSTSKPNIYALGDCAEVNGVTAYFVPPLRWCAQALAQTLTGNKTAVSYPALSLSVKTPACPTVVASPPSYETGTWQIEGKAHNLKALFYNRMNQLSGFVLMGTQVTERNPLIQQLPKLF